MEKKREYTKEEKYDYYDHITLEFFLHYASIQDLRDYKELIEQEIHKYNEDV